MLKKIGFSLLGAVLVLTILAASAIVWLRSTIGELPQVDSTITTKQIPYIADAVSEQRGRILAVVTSADVMGNSGKKTGYELTELARAYYVFTANGFDVDIASILGGKPPVVIDKDDMAEFDYAFLNDEEAQHKVDNSIAIASVNPADYQAIYFVGGKGAMFDFPDNDDVQRVVKNMFQDDKVVAAVCHGPAALVNVQLDNGNSLVAGRKISSFTNSEELLLISDAESIFPFLLESKLRQQNANFQPGPNYLNQVSRDGNLITGQNPWSVWQLAEAVVSQLGYKPKQREITATERALEVLHHYQTQGYEQAVSLLIHYQSQNIPVNKMLIAMHGVVEAMEWDISSSFSHFRLLNQAGG